jgi:hypothetical protein
MGDGFDGDELTANVTYRLAYGEAYRVAEMRGRSFAHSRDRVRDVRLEAEAMARDIGRRLGVEPAAIVCAVRSGEGLSRDTGDGGRPGTTTSRTPHRVAAA